ncbi:hypothetical protein [Burkholderia vietnamiensis]|uniref:hypothetical protein n=1 Tax=Burkholderia vietnamiensis TaxID=60552 RepID=UPI001FCA2DB1|nr:hypothetical protein [Burkholderia vietnamiensis]
MREVRVCEELVIAVDQHTSAAFQARGRRRIEARCMGLDVAPQLGRQLRNFLIEILLGELLRHVIPAQP